MVVLNNLCVVRTHLRCIMDSKGRREEEDREEERDFRNNGFRGRGGGGVAEVEEDLTEAVKRVETPIRCQWGKGKDLEMMVTRTFWIGVLGGKRWRQLDQGVQE